MSKVSNGQYVHEYLAESLRKMGFYIEVSHEVYAEPVLSTAHGTLNRPRKINALTTAVIKKSIGDKRKDGPVVSVGCSVCLDGDQFNKRVGVTNALRKAWINASKNGSIDRDSALQVSRSVLGNK